MFIQITSLAFLGCISLNSECISADKDNDELDCPPNERLNHDYDGFKTRQCGVRVDQLWNYVYSHKQEGYKQLYEEFGLLKSGLAHLHEVAISHENKHKNRYKGLYPYDHSRVKLEVGAGHSDYINASFINGFGNVSKFIASQGPTNATFNDFWSMIWQQGTLQIVMLTSLKEKGVIKCAQYWPNEGSTRYGHVKVKLLSTTNTPDITIRHLNISMAGQAVRRVTHFQYESWPDKDVPDSTWSLVHFWRTVMTSYKTAGIKPGPIVVHCSAGVGRTGTFIALDNLYEQAEMEGCVTPLNVVDFLRDQRAYMVQTKEQYVYLHEAIADALLIGTHAIKPQSLRAVYNFLLENDEHDLSVRRLDKQHQLIMAGRKYDVADILEEPEYSNVTFLKPFSTEEPQPSLSSITLPYHSGSAGFILVNSPIKETSDQLWSLISENNITTVVTISGPSVEESHSRTVLEVQNSAVEIVEETVTEDYVSETFRIPRGEKLDDKVSSFDLKFFAFKILNEHSNVPTDVAHLLRCISSMRAWQSQLSNNQPILIICRDNMQGAGLFCVIMSEIDRCSGPIGNVNIVESVQLVRASYPAMMDSVGHYQFVFDVLTSFIQSPP